MWRESTKERADRYRKILAQAPELLVNVPTSDDDVIQIVARYVTGPALYAYIDWVIRSALQAGQTRLYFLARDGYLMYHAAQIYCEANDISIDCRYLYCSRYALRIPMYHLNRADATEYICRNGINITPERILRRSGMDGELCRQLAKDYFPQWEPDRELSRQELAQLTEQLKANDDFWKRCAAYSKSVYPEAERYLMQEGLLDDVPYALVDSGWIGSMQKTLGQLLEQLRCKQAAGSSPASIQLKGYYWGLYDLPSGANSDDYHTYYFVPSAGESEKCAFNNNLFEVLYSAPHGMTVGYQNGEPIFGKEQPEQVELIKKMEPELMQYVKTVSERNVSLETKESNQGKDAFRYRSIIRELFACLMCQPTREEARIFGGVPFSDDIFAEAGIRMAEPASEEALNSNHPINKMLLAKGLRKGKEFILPWYAGSAVLSEGNTGRHLRAYHTYQKFLVKKQERDWRYKT